MGANPYHSVMLKVGKHKFLFVGEVADKLGVHPQTVRHYAKKKHLKSIKHDNGYVLFRESDIDEFIDRFQEMDL